jgi:acyl carrier protein
MSTDPTQTLRAWIVANLFGGQAPAGFDDDTDLIADGVMDSLAILHVLTHLESEHGIAVGDGDIVPEHFASVRALAAFVIARR